MSHGPERHVTNADALRALAHEVRLNLLDALAASPHPLTVTEAAEILGESPANCSWHMRQLAKYGFVVEAPRAAGRRRPWQLAREGFEWADRGDDRVTSQAARMLSRMVLSRELEKYVMHLENPADSQWESSAFSNAAQLWLTPEELRDIGKTFSLTLEPYAARLRSDTRPAGSAYVRVVAWGAPDVQHIPPKGSSPGQRQ